MSDPELILPETALAAIRAHAEQAYPDECCGMILGRLEGRCRAGVRIERARNLLASDGQSGRDRYELDPADRLRADRAAEADGLSLVGFYHSHPDHDAYFSETDCSRSEEAQWGEPWLPPTYAYLVVSVREGAAKGHAVFEVSDGQSVEIGFRVASPCA